MIQGTPDYARYTDDQLEYELRHLNDEEDPERFKVLLREMDERIGQLALEADERSRSRKGAPQAKERRALVAFLFSWFAPGLGQLYCGRLRRGITLFLVEAATAILAALIILELCPALLKSFHGMLVMLAILLIPVGLTLYISIDACLLARRTKMLRLRPYNRWYVYAGILLAVILLPDPGELLVTEIKKSVRTFKIPSSSMEPSLTVGDHFMADIKYYGKEKPKRGDVALFLYPKDRTKDFVQRVIGLGGETLEIRDKRVYVNGRRIEDPWGTHLDAVTLTARQSPRDNMAPVRIPEGSVFVMGDNRDRSLDSRFFGVVPEEDVFGKPLYFYWAEDKRKIGTQVK